MRLLTRLLLLLFVLLSGNALAAKRMALLVGANTGWKGDQELLYAEEDARRLGAVLTELGGFAAQDVVTLAGPRTQDLRAQLQSLKKHFESASGEESFFLFYYSGHADEQNLHLRGDPLSLEALHGLLREMPATVKVGILDACRSGGILTAKGASRRAPEFQLDVRNELNDVRGTVLLTSSGADELSHEARSRTGSLFTNHLVSALRGAADDDRDQRISLEEAYTYAFTRTQLDTVTTPGMRQRPSFLKDVKGRGNLYLTWLEKHEAVLRFEPGGRHCFVLTPDERRLAAEVVPWHDKSMSLALAPGQYVLKCRGEGKYLVTSVELKKGALLEVAGLRFREVPFEEGVIKGSQGEMTRALGHKLVAHAELVRSQQPEQSELSLLLATEGLRRVSSPEARQVLQRGLERLPHAGVCMKHSAPVLAAAWSRDGKHLATSDQNKAIHIWNPETGAKLSQVLHSRPVVELAWSAEGSVLGLRDFQGGALQWRFEAGSATNTLLALPLHAISFDAVGKYSALMDQGETLSLRRQADSTEVLRVNSMRPLLKFSTNGRFLAAQDVSGKARVWEIATRQELLATLPTDASTRVSMLSISPGGKFLALGSAGARTVQIWDVASGRQLPMPPYEESVSALAFASPNTLLIASEDKMVRLWEVTTGRELSRMPHTARIEAMSLSPDGRWLVTTWVGGHSASVWNVSTGQELTRLAHQGLVTAVAWSPREGWLATASADGMACVWGLTGPEVTRMRHWGQHAGMAFTPDGQRLVTATQEEPARVWEVATGRRVAQVKDRDGAHLFALSPDGKTLASAVGPLARVWDVATGRELSRLRHGGLIHALAFSPGGSTVATASRDGTARVWEAATGTEHWRMRHEGPVRAVAFSPHGELLATGGEDETARVWELAKGTELLRLRHKTLPCQERSAPDPAPCYQAWLADSSATVRLVRFSPDGRHLATATLDAVARLWSIPDGKEVLRQPHSTLIRALAFTPDGKGLAIANGEPVVKIWSVETGGQLASLEAEGDTFFLQYSNDGKQLLTASAQGTMNLWEVSSGRVLARMEGGPHAEAFLLSPDGRYVAMAQRQSPGRPLLYSIQAWQTEDLLQQACLRLRRNLTAQEWHEYLGEAEPYQKTCAALP